MSKTRSERSTRVAPESRRAPVAGSEGRESRDRADDGRQDDMMELTQEEREQMLRDEAMQNQLPNPPKKAGVHYFWASMENRFTPVSWYKRLGYKVVPYDSMKGWADANMRQASGDYAGCITVNEMLLMECSESSYQRFMTINHHEKPNQEQQRARQSIDAAKDLGGEDSSGRALVTEVGKGFETMDRKIVKRVHKFES